MASRNFLGRRKFFPAGAARPGFQKEWHMNHRDRLDQFLQNHRRALWSLAVPVLFGMAVQTVYSIADMIFVGMISPLAITAVSFNFPLIFFAMGITFGLGSGLTAVIARNVGADDSRRAENAAEHGLLLAAALALVFTFTGVVFGRRILALLGTTPSVLQDAAAYFRIISLGFPFLISSVFFRSIFNGEGNTRTPMYIQMTGTVLNIILDPVFIFVFRLGVSGAALATILSQFLVAAIFLYIIYIRKGSSLTYDFRAFVFQRSLITDIFRIGFPASLSMIIMSVGSGVFNFILIHYSEYAVAGYQVAGRLDQIYFLPVMALAMFLVTLVGMFYGARRFDLIVKVIRYGVGNAVFIGVVSGILFWLAAPWVFPLFTDSPEIQQVAVSYIRTPVFVYPLISVGITSGRIMQGLGAGIPLLVITSIRVVLLSAPLASFFAFFLDKPLQWVWYAMLGSIVVSATTAFFWLRHRLRLARRELATAEVTPDPQPLSPLA